MRIEAWRYNETWHRDEPIAERIPRDMRNTKEPAYSHNCTHSDDITHLSLLPSTSTYLNVPTSSDIPDRLLFSASTDGLVALSNMKQTDEEEALIAAESWGQSIAAASTYVVKGKNGMSVWARSDMDAVATWDISRDPEGDILVGFGLCEDA